MMMLLAQAAWNDAEAWTRVFARAHPVLVHFPIALILTAAGLEFLGVVGRKDRPSPTALICCGLGVLGALAASVSGWLNADVESHPARLAQTMQWHRWVGIAGGAAAVVAWVLGLAATREGAVLVRRWWRFLLILSAGAIGFAGHLGGNMVWGDGFITEPLFRHAGVKPVVDASAAPGELPVRSERSAARLAPAGSVLTVDFRRDIVPILEAHCYECHGGSRRKGDLRLDDLSNLYQGDETYWPIKPGHADESELVYRIMLGTDSEDRMPPEGAPLSPDDVGLISRWIAEGAWEGVTGSGGGTTPQESSEGATNVGVDPGIAAGAWTKDERDAIAVLRASGARVEPVSIGSSRLDVNLAVGGRVVPVGAIAALARVGPRVDVLNVSGTTLSDETLAGAFDRLTSLRRLEASGSGAGDRTARAAAGLASIRVVNFFGCGLTDAGAAALSKCGQLTSVCVAETGVSEAGRAELKAALSDAVVEVGER